MNLAEGFLIGFLGSIHCIGMCGPIALMIPTSKNPFLKFFQIISYNFGRVLTYSLFGLFFGLIGESVRFMEIQQFVSIALGLILIVIVIGTLFSYHKAANRANKIVTKLFNPIKKKFGKSLGKERKNLLAIGILNGFLPCGLIYFALAASITSESIAGSTFFMAAFGAGTIPAMLIFMYFKSAINQKINLQKVVPYMLLAMGMLLVMRGMNLGIPYLSPEIKSTENKEVTMGGCCSADKQFETE
ncbi:MAG: sulfite exporter TauE/SafE family protein [Flavobacteriales bacterium]